MNTQGMSRYELETLVNRQEEKLDAKDERIAELETAARLLDKIQSGEMYNHAENS